jgi:sulfoxide reductase heme-binding subunit YedZ
VWIACAAPLGFCLYWLLTGGLGANPINTGMRFLGLWGLRFLIIGLALRPLRDLFGWSVLMRYRRTLGLFAFFYVSLHLTVYVGVDQFFDGAAIWKDIVKRPYITFGMIAFLALVPLAITSTNGMIKRLGPLAWRQLHRAVYIIVPLGVLHYDLLVKSDVTAPRAYGAIVLALLGLRGWIAWRKRRPKRPHAARPLPENPRPA